MPLGLLSDLDAHDSVPNEDATDRRDTCLGVLSDLDANTEGTSSKL